MSEQLPQIAVTPVDGLIDTPRQIVLRGFPHGAVRLQAMLQEADGSVWQGEAWFTSDGADIDLDQVKPDRGDWHEAKATAVITSLRQTGEGQRTPESTEPLSVQLRAFGENGCEARATLTERFLAPGVERRAIAQGGVVGTLFTPAAGGPHPVVVVLAGSGGGLMERRAALYAAHGYTALALGYFGAPGLPSHISATPLEYFEKALIWVHNTLTPAGGFVALSGVSRGGELSLLLAATFPDLVSAVIAYVPSPVTHGVLNAGRPGEDRHAPAWLHHGQPLPVLSAANRTADWDLFDKATGPRRQALALDTALDDAEAVTRALIPLQQIAGPVLLISGQDDGLWPSTRFSEIAERQLRTAGHPFTVRHVSYPDTGHSIGIPFQPNTVLERPHPVSGIVLAFGGTVEGNAHASVDSWREVLAFLAEATSA